MATETSGHPPQEILAIAFVVESSLTVANEWPRLITEYISPVLKRLLETNPGYKPRMGFVTYATAGVIPSPILCKRFFAEPQPVTKEMREHPAKLGIGHTNSGGGMGMAALEGLVAAIELFDILRHVTPQQTRPNAQHIIHVASAAPDASIHPQCNDSPLLDCVTWEDIPNEFKKRNINFSTMNLRQNLPRFSEVHSAIAPGAPKEPWFAVRAPHTILLANFPVPVPRAAKRPGEAQNNERPAENKRPRMGNHSEASPKIVTPNTPSMQPKPAQASSSPAVPRPAPATAAAMPAQPSPQGPFPNTPQYQTLMTNMAGLQEQIRSLSTSLDNARTTGNTTLAENIQQDLNKKTLMFEKFEQILKVYNLKAPAHAKAQAQALQVAHQNQVQHLTQEAQTAGPSSQKVPLAFPLDPAPPTAVLQEENRIDTQGVAQPNQIRPVGPFGPLPTGSQPLVSMPAGTTAAMASQMQKMVQQSTRPLEGSSQHAGVPQNMDIKPQGAASQHQDGRGPVVPVWHGSLSWNGVSPAGRKEMTAFVVASTTNIAMSRAETWPTALTLVPTRDPAIPMSELQLWVKRHKPVICSIAPQPNVPDPKGNETALKMLIQLLAAKNVYAAAAWTLPSGEQGNNVLFFPGPGGLVGAFFPVTGIPEIPKAGAHALTVPSSVSQEFLVRLQAMPPEQREMVMTQLKRQRELHLQQQQQQQQALMKKGVVGPGNSVGVNNAMLAMNVVQNQMAQQQQQQQQQHTDLAFGGGVPGYGGMNAMQQKPPAQAVMMNGGMRMGSMPGANINMEMMQSFMQRNSDGSSG